MVIIHAASSRSQEQLSIVALPSILICVQTRSKVGSEDAEVAINGVEKMRSLTCSKEFIPRKPTLLSLPVHVALAQFHNA